MSSSPPNTTFYSLGSQKRPIIYYLDPAAASKYQDLAFVSSEGAVVRTNRLLFASLSSLDTLLARMDARVDESDTALTVEMPTNHLKTVLGFVQTGTIPANLATECLRAFELLGISLQDKHFVKETVGPQLLQQQAFLEQQNALHQQRFLNRQQQQNQEQDPITVPDPQPMDQQSQYQQQSETVTAVAAEMQKLAPQIIVKAETKEDSNVLETVIEFVGDQDEGGDVMMQEQHLQQQQQQQQSSLVQIQFPEVCDLCDKGCGTKDGLICHQMNVHGYGKEFKCKYCPRRFKLREQLTFHQNRHRVYQCSFCTTVFNNQGSRNAHESSWHDPAKLAMLPPPKKSMGNHKRRRRRDQPRTDDLVVNCHICGREFKGRTSPETLKNHIIRVHTSDAEKPFQCHVCNKGFSGRAHLETHLLIHENKKPFECSTCGASFNNRGNRNAHERSVHLGLKTGDVKGSRKIGKMEKRMQEETPEERAERWRRKAEEQKMQMVAGHPLQQQQLQQLQQQHKGQHQIEPSPTVVPNVMQQGIPHVVQGTIEYTTETMWT